MRVVYFDCFSGISGDMALAALIDAGANRQYIEDELKKLPIEPFTLHYNKVVKKGVTGLKLDVLLDPATEIVHHRHFVDIVQMIDQSQLPQKVKARAKKIFEKIGKAEAKVHNISLDHVHFHEVGAVDSIVDIIGVSLALEDLRIEQIYTSPIPLGSGQIKIEHGIYPIPTPATLEILKGIPIRSSQVPYEMTTPTGAGIVAALGTDFHGYPSMTVQAIGYGAGAKDFDDRPNVLRAVIGTTNELYLTEPQFSLHHDHEHHHQEHHHDHHNPLTMP
ncbi:LarC family nickel insertion protein [Tepidibacillus fermentans]|uniref:LarC family nickel insertion protein n=1 Tax=Tepidibacillus fermentans TaxID=1281767 RepID=A0A4R3KHZ1_9BACI|nr:LarC family nickel insertion protein [Tepidibacillus fermentans]TCS83097.1 hypothetical protein EDD72_10623 [Tepidibacillus fermentans]